jgi:hypothetical protein
MSQNTKGYKPRNFRIISIRTAKRILHIEDHLDIDRIMFDLWSYAKGNGADNHVQAWVERHTARVIAMELAAGRLTATDGLQDQGGGTINGTITARIFTIENADTKNPIRITVSNAPGERQANGLISYKTGSTPTRISILLSPLDAKRIGLAILDHIRAWEVRTLFDRRDRAVWNPTPTGTEIELCPKCSCRPCICDTLDNTPDPTTGEVDTDDDLTYADGTIAGLTKDPEAELAAFAMFVKSQKRKPKDVEALRVWVMNQ